MVYLLSFTMVFSGFLLPGSSVAQVTQDRVLSLKEVPVPVPQAAVVRRIPPEGIRLNFQPLTTAIVKDQAALVRLGKALFWDMQVGSDGIMACASCHFNAGEDTRSKNQVSPGLADTNFHGPMGGDNLFGNSTVPFTANDPNNPVGPIEPPDPNFNVPGHPSFTPNCDLVRADFPLNGWFNPTAKVPRRPFPPNVTVFEELALVDIDTNDVIGSQGVRNTQFVAVTPRSAVDQGTPLPDIFNVVTPGQFNLEGRVRRVTGRNAPTTINAVFNFENFWDGRASFIFNGVNPFGFRDRTSTLKKLVNGVMEDVFVRVTNSSAASQAVGPPLSDMEMSWAGRSFPDLGKKMLTLRPLNKQLVHPKDSVLGPLSLATLDGQGNVVGHKGLNTGYKAMIRQAFHRSWWASPDIIIVDTGTAAIQKASVNDPRTMVVSPGKAMVVKADQVGAMALTPMQVQYTQMEYNFSLFWGLAVQAYEATLISDDTPFDRYMGAPTLNPPIPPDPTAMTPQEILGFTLFNEQGRCFSCHKLPIGSSATVFDVQPDDQGVPRPGIEDGILETMAMADGQMANYDHGFYNTSVRRFSEDIARAGTAPNAPPFLNPLDDNKPFPLSYVELTALKMQGKLPTDVARFVPNQQMLPRRVTTGAFKNSNVRNQEYRGPYFHNGDSATLRQVAEFYARGGNFPNTNINFLTVDIDGIPDIQFPEFIPNSRINIEALVAFSANALTDQRVVFERAPFDHPQLFIPNGSPAGAPDQDLFLELLPVGSGGRATPIPRFLNLDPQDPGA
jgi:cytochrome c peroxidase